MHWWTLQQLKSRDVSIRLLAVDKLAGESSLKAGEALISAFADADGSVRKAAAKALAGTHNDLFLQPLARALRDRDERVRESAADALRQLRNPACVPTLVPLLSDSSAIVRWQASRALEAFNWSPSDNASGARFAVARGKIEDAAKFGSEAVDALTTVLQCGAYHQRREAVAALQHIADARVVKALLVALKDSDDQVRSAAIEALNKIADPSCADALVLALKDSSKQVRALAAAGLGLFGGNKSVAPLLRCVADRDWEVREAVCVALGRLKDSRVMDPLVAALKDGDREVREAAVRGLGHLNDPRAIGPVLLTLVDEQDSVRQVALVTLSTLNLHWERTETAKNCVPQLQESLKHSQYWVRQAAAEALARIGGMKLSAPASNSPAPSSDEVTPVIADPSHLRKQTTVDVLVALLTDFDHELRFAAAEALGRLGQSRAVLPLSQSFKDTDKAVRKAAAGAVEMLHGKPTAETTLILRGEEFPL